MADRPTPERDTRPIAGAPRRSGRSVLLTLALVAVTLVAIVVLVARAGRV